jgi:predicted N-acetyltransferase YhbS
MTEVVIRKMGSGDSAAVVSILERWNMVPRAPSAQLPDPERTGLEPERTFVAVAGGALVGVASYFLLGEGWAETASLAVDPAWRGKGIGARLQRARLDELRALGITHVRTEADRPETIEWYQRKFGYRVTGTSPKKHDFGRHDVAEWTILVLDLQENPT